MTAISGSSVPRMMMGHGFMALILVWVLLLVLLPGLLARDTGGRVVTMVSAGTYVVASLICHQRPDRSFRLGGVQMPVCARCAGVYLGGAVGTLLASVRRRKDGRRARVTTPALRWVLLGAAIPTVVSVMAEFGGWLPSGRELRAVAALPLGATVTWVASLVIRGELA